MPALRSLIVDIYRGGQLMFTRRFPPDKVITIGSGSNANLLLPEEDLAEIQVMIHRDDLGLYQLVELLSTNTRVNGQPGHRAWLPDGSRVEIGSTRLRFWHSETHRPDPGPSLEEASLEAAEPPPAAETAAPPVSPPPARLEAAEPAAAPAALEEPLSTPEEAPGAPPLPEEPLPSPLLCDEALPAPGRPLDLEILTCWQGAVIDIQHLPVERLEATLSALTRRRGYAPPAGIDPSWTLLRSCGEGVELRLKEEWSGWLFVGDASIPLSATARPVEPGVYAALLSPGQRLSLEIGGLTFNARFAERARRLPPQMIQRVDAPFVGILSSLAFVGALFAALMFTTPPAPASQLGQIPDRLLDVLLNKPESARILESRWEDSGGGEAAKRAEGKSGSPEAKLEQARAVKPSRQVLDREVVADAGVLGFLNHDSGALDGVFGSSGLNDMLTDALAGLSGPKGMSLGSGLGRDGFGPGGGGSIDGVQGPGTSGRAGGRDGYGRVGESGPGKETGGLVSEQPPIVMGTIDRAEVERVIKQHLSAIRYCYQRELPRSPELAGKVVVKFVISQNGTVSSVKTQSSTLGSPAVEECINGRFLTFQFPTPKAGGIVLVSYPFLFSL